MSRAANEDDDIETTLDAPDFQIHMFTDVYSGSNLMKWGRGWCKYVLIGETRIPYVHPLVYRFAKPHTQSARHGNEFLDDCTTCMHVYMDSNQPIPMHICVVRSKRGTCEGVCACHVVCTVEQSTNALTT